jgi:hypothetical protein
VLGFGAASGAPAVRIDRMGPDNYWFGARPQIVSDPRGPGVVAMIGNIGAAAARKSRAARQLFRKNMMADYRHIGGPENRLGRHYS